MSVTINNVSERPSEDGVNYYEVTIGPQVIASFAHIRSDGLASCLRRAAAAVERATSHHPVEPSEDALLERLHALEVWAWGGPDNRPGRP